MNTSVRPAHAFWSDVRFFIGIALVAASIAAVWFIVTSARETAPTLQTTRTIVVGEVLTSADFRTVDVGLGVLADDYLTPAELAPGLIATRTIPAGELLPRTATAPADSARTTTVVIDSAAAVPESIEAGSLVELWSAAPQADARGFETPAVLVSAATVAAVIPAQGMMSRGGTTLEIVIDRSEVGAVLAAITDGSVLSVVPVGRTS